MRHALAVLAVAALVGVARPGGDAGKKVLATIQGTWRFTSVVMDGKESPPEELKGRTITFSGDKWVVRQGGKTLQAGTHKFDPGKKPPQVDAAVTEGEGKGNTMLGIYEQKGDTLRVCFDPQGKERPTSFAPKAGQFGATVRREKK
jgi:uncharacterized protein (TIGR03067 family)